MSSAKSTATDAKNAKQAESDFSYTRVNRCTVDESIEAGGYQAYINPQVKGFILFEKMVKQSNRDPRLMFSKSKVAEIKFHLSVSDNNLEKGWEIFNTLFMKHNLLKSKVVKDANREQLQSGAEAGKTITIYVPPNQSVASLTQFMDEVTRAFIANGIQPGVLPASDTTVTGSSYFSYRRNVATGGGVVALHPLEQIALNIAGQPPRPKPPAPEKENSSPCICQ